VSNSHLSAGRETGLGVGRLRCFLRRLRVGVSQNRTTFVVLRLARTGLQSVGCLLARLDLLRHGMVLKNREFRQVLPMLLASRASLAIGAFIGGNRLGAVGLLTTPHNPE
jgi:hypothetical protein